MNLPVLALTSLLSAAPPLSVHTLDGKEAPLSQYSGKVTVVAVWATFCAPCTQELPHVEALAQQYAHDPDVRFLGMSLDPADSAEQRAKIAADAKSLGLTFPVVTDPGPATKALLAEPDGTQSGLFGMPALVILDSAGHRFREMGFSPDTAGRFETDQARLIEAARHGALPLDAMGPTAREAEHRASQGDAAGALPLYAQAYAAGVRSPFFEYDAACAASRTGHADESFSWLDRATSDGFDDAGWMQQDPDLAPLHKDPRFAEAVKHATAQHDAALALEHPKDAALQHQILALVSEDQAIRARVSFANAKDPVLWKQIRETDARSTAFMKKTLAAHGWPGKTLVGRTAAHGAWLLVQHAENELPFMEKCVRLLERAVKTGDAEAQDLAYLSDRVRMMQKRPQLYGTQFLPKDGKMVPSPIADPAHLDARRKAIGLGPFADYQKMIEMQFAAHPPQGH